MKRALCIAFAAALILCGCTPIESGEVSSALTDSQTSEAQVSIDKTDKIITVPSEDDPNWALFLVNNYNQLPDDYAPEMAIVAGDREFHHKAAEDFQNMLDAALEDGFNFYVASTYRTIEYQRNLLERNIQDRIDQGMTEEEARRDAEFNVQKPGKSEHNTGLAADIVSEDWFSTHDDLTQDFDQTPEFAWLSQNAYKYGFILRYPKDKEDITEITYEPWHYRYVGIENAKKIKDSGLCLEEYLSQQK